MVATFRQPFDMLAETASAAARVELGEKAKSSKSEIWLPFLNTYRTMCTAPSFDFLQALEGISALRVAAQFLARAKRTAGVDVERTLRSRP